MARNRPIVTCQPRRQTAALNAYLAARSAMLPCKIVLVDGHIIHTEMYGFNHTAIFLDIPPHTTIHAVARDKIDAIHSPTLVWKSRLGDLGAWHRANFAPVHRQAAGDR